MAKDDPELLAMEYVAPVAMLIQLGDREPTRTDECLQRIETHINRLTRITTCHFLFNDASRRVIEKCGFKKREVAPFPSDDPNEPDQDSQWYELSRGTSSRQVR